MFKTVLGKSLSYVTIDPSVRAWIPLKSILGSRPEKPAHGLEQQLLPERVVVLQLLDKSVDALLEIVCIESKYTSKLETRIGFRVSQVTDQK